MTPLERFLERREKKSPGFKKYVEDGLEEFIIKALIEGAMEKAGLTQETLAKRMHTKQEAVSRWINHAQDIKLSTLNRVARACGKQMVVTFK